VAGGSVDSRNLHTALFIDLLIHKLVVLAQKNPTKRQSTHRKIIKVNILIMIVQRLKLIQLNKLGKLDSLFLIIVFSPY